jgi:hypothetical protein
MSRDVVIAKSASVGGELDVAALEAKVAADLARDRFRAASRKLAPQPTTQESPDDPRAIAVRAARQGSVQVTGDTATLLTPQNARIAFQKVEGQWKLDLSRWGTAAPKAQRMERDRQAAALMNELTARIESGQITSQEQLEQEMATAERKVKAAQKSAK